MEANTMAPSFREWPVYCPYEQHTYPLQNLQFCVEFAVCVFSIPTEHKKCIVDTIEEGLKYFLFLLVCLILVYRREDKKWADSIYLCIYVDSDKIPDSVKVCTTIV